MRSAKLTGYHFLRSIFRPLSTYGRTVSLADATPPRGAYLEPPLGCYNGVSSSASTTAPVFHHVGRVPLVRTHSRRGPRCSQFCTVTFRLSDAGSSSLRNERNSFGTSKPGPSRACVLSTVRPQLPHGLRSLSDTALRHLVAHGGDKVEGVPRSRPRGADRLKSYWDKPRHLYSIEVAVILKFLRQILQVQNA